MSNHLTQQTTDKRLIDLLTACVRFCVCVCVCVCECVCACVCLFVLVDLLFSLGVIDCSVSLHGGILWPLSSFIENKGLNYL